MVPPLDAGTASWHRVPASRRLAGRRCHIAPQQQEDIARSRVQEMTGVSSFGCWLLTVLYKYPSQAATELFTDKSLLFPVLFESFCRQFFSFLRLIQWAGV